MGASVIWRQDSFWDVPICAVLWLHQDTYWKIEGIDNYHLTWSYSEATKKYAKLFDAVPNNKAVVFRKTLPSFFKGLKVIDGDTHDMRFLDEDNVVVGLKAKGKAKKDYSGFVIDNEKIETRTMICL